MRFLALIMTLAVALGVAASPMSMVTGPSIAFPSAVAHADHHHHDVDQSGMEGTPAAQACAHTQAACSPVSADGFTEPLHAKNAPDLPSHSGAGCCDMSSCHAFMLIAACKLHHAGLRPLQHVRVATLLVPSSFTSRIERPPRFV